MRAASVVAELAARSSSAASAFQASEMPLTPMANVPSDAPATEMAPGRASPACDSCWSDEMSEPMAATAPGITCVPSEPRGSRNWTPAMVGWMRSRKLSSNRRCRSAIIRRCSWSIARVLILTFGVTVVPGALLAACTPCLTAATRARCRAGPLTCGATIMDPPPPPPGTPAPGMLRARQLREPAPCVTPVMPPCCGIT